MRLNILNRKIHYWGAIIVALPLAVVIVSGILLQLKKQLDWVQPPEKRGTGKGEPALSFAEILALCASVPEAEVRSWSDIDRIDVRPSKGMMKVQAKNGWEIQIDSHAGKVLQTAYRRSDLIESIHDGSWFHDHAKLWLFLPAACLLLVLWMTGMYLFWLPIYVRARRRREAARKASQANA